MQRKLLCKLLTPNREKVQKIYFRNLKNDYNGSSNKSIFDLNNLILFKFIK